MNTRASHPGAPERKNGNKPSNPNTTNTAARAADAESKPADTLKAKAREQWEEGSATAAKLADSVSDEIKAGVGEVKATAANAVESLGELTSDAQAALEETGRSIVRAAKDNPVPAALIGLGCVGVGMLLVDALRPSNPRRTTASSKPGATATPSGRVGRNGGATAGLGRRAQTSLTGARDTAMEALTSVADKAGKQTERLQGFIEQNPLKAGAGGLAIGVGIGLLIPTMDREHQWLGKGRDQVIERTQQFAHDMLEKLENVTQTVTEVVGGKQDQAEGTAARDA